MTDAAKSATAPAKPKKFGFKKAAWQTAPKTQDEDDLFRHNEFKQKVALELKLKEEEKKEAQRRAEQTPKRKSVEEREPKRRKVSATQEEETPRSNRSASLASKGRTKTPLSPARHGSVSDTLAARYDSLTKSSSSSASTAKRSIVVDLDSDSEKEDDFKLAPTPSPRPIPIHTRSNSRRESSEEVEEVHARAKTPQKESTPPSESNSPTPEPEVPVAIVELLVHSWIPDTNALLIKIRTDSSLERPKEAWCKKQGFTGEQRDKVFMTWRGRRIFDYTKIHRLGIEVDKNGSVTVKGDPAIYDDDENRAKIAIEAWTEDIWKKRKDIEAMEAAQASNNVVEVEDDPVPEPEPEQESEDNSIRVIMKAKGKKDFKIRVRTTTTIEHLTQVYKGKLGIPEDQPVTLMWDGDRLTPLDTIGDTEVEDMDVIEAHI